MMPSLPFSILQIPKSILAEILEFIGPAELVSLSLCSQKTNNLIRKYRCSEKSKNWELWIVAGAQARAMIHYRDTLEAHDVLGAISESLLQNSNAKSEGVRIQNLTVPAVQWRGYLVTFWEDPIVGLKKITDYVCELFGGITVSNIGFYNFNLWMIDWVLERQEVPLKCSSLSDCGGRIVRDEDFEYYLRKIQPTEALTVNAKPSENFKFRGIFSITDEMFIRWGHWITLGGLMNMDSIEISIWNSTFSCEEINIFIKFWLSGGSPRLRPHGIEFECEDGYCIKRTSDGAKAILNRTRSAFFLLVCFEE